MALSASYVSGTSFTVSTDKTSDFAPGRAVYCDCGVDGVKYAYVSYSTYSDPNTTVTLDSTESQAITSNLSEVLFSRVQYKETGANVPVQVVWMQRGFKSGMTLSWKDADEIYVDSGALHIDNGTAENIYCAQSQLTKQLTSLSASTWYAIYVDPPDNGLSLAAADIEYSSTMPSYDQAKRGWYHGTNTDWRCIGFVLSNGSSQIAPFLIAGPSFLLNHDDSIVFVNGTTPSNTWTDATCNAPLGNMTIIAKAASIYGNTAGAALQVRPNGSAGAGSSVIGTDQATSTYSSRYIIIDSNKIFEYRFSSACTNIAYFELLGFLLPNGL